MKFQKWNRYLYSRQTRVRIPVTEKFFLSKMKRDRTRQNKGCGGGLVVSVLAFYSDDPSSIPAEIYNFFCKIVVEKN